jgi:hypothetical protein
MADPVKLLIEIETLLKDQGAEKTLQVLRDAQKQLKQQTDDSKTSGDGLNKTMERTSSVARILSMAMNGTAEGFRSAGHAAGTFFGTLTKLSWVGGLISLIGALAAIVAQLKAKFGDAKKGIDDVDDAAKKAETDWKAAVDAINERTFEKLRREIAAVEKGYKDAADKAELLARIQLMLSKSGEEKDLAALDLEASTTGMPEHQKARRALDITRKYEVERLQDEGKNIAEDLNRNRVEASDKQSRIDSLTREQNTAADEFQRQFDEARKLGLDKIMTPYEIKNGDFGAAIQRLSKGIETTTTLGFDKGSGIFGNDPNSESAQTRRGLQAWQLRIQRLQFAAAKAQMRTEDWDKLVPGLQTSRDAAEASVSEGEAKLKDLDNRTRTAQAKYAVQSEALMRAENAGSGPSAPAPNRDVTGLRRANSYEWEKITGSVLPEWRDEYGTRHGGSAGWETRNEALGMIERARGKVMSKSGDTAADQRVIDDLVSALQASGTVMTESYDKLRDRIMQLEKNTAEMRKRLNNKDSQSAAQDAFGQ